MDYKSIICIQLYLKICKKGEVHVDWACACLPAPPPHDYLAKPNVLISLQLCSSSTLPLSIITGYEDDIKFIVPQDSSYFTR